jgi:chemotaxis protein MotA
MNFSTIFGFLSASVVVITAMMMSSSNFSMFMNGHAILVVIGGSLAATFISFPIGKVRVLFSIAMKRLFRGMKTDYVALIEDIVMLAKASRQSQQSFLSAINRVRDPFLKDAAGILEWGQSEIDADQLRDLLETRADTHYKRYLAEANVFRSISKFPPAFGLVGTTLGMIALMNAIGDTGGDRNIIGPSMAIALVATLYGLLLTNLILLPISENLTQMTEEDNVSRRIVVESVMMIYSRLPTRFIEEKAKSFLLPSERGFKPSTLGSGPQTSAPAAASSRS